jgi:hypothetical protein
VRQDITKTDTTINCIKAKRSIGVTHGTIVLAFALFSGATLPALAGASLDVPILPGAPEGFGKGSVADLGRDPVDNRSADEAATVHVYSDGTTLFVRFDAPQSEALTGGKATLLRSTFGRTVRVVITIISVSISTDRIHSTVRRTPQTGPSRSRFMLAVTTSQ